MVKILRSDGTCAGAESVDFEGVLQDVVQGAEGAVAAILMDGDGLAIGHYAREGGEDIEAIGVEYGAILKEVRRACEMLETGQAVELTVRAERMVTVLRQVGDGYAVAVTLRPEGNVGKARYLLRLRAPDLAEALA